MTDFAKLPGAETIETSGNRPFLVDDPEQAWIITAGYLDLFIVQVVDRQWKGQRVPLLQMFAGQGAFGMAPMEGRSLLAVGNADTRLVRVPLSALRSSTEPDVVAVVEGWIRGLQGGLHAPYPPPECKRVTSPSSIDLETGETVTVSRGVLWAAVGDGISLFGKVAIPAGMIVPLTPSLWLQSEAKSTLQFTTTETALATTKSWEGRAFVQKMMLTRAVELSKSEEANDRQRLLAHAEQEGITLDEALHDMVGILAPTASRFVYLSRHSDALLGACEIVGAAQGLKIRRPASSTDGIAADALWRIARASRCQTRPVMLDDGWWRRDNGPLVGFLKDGQRPVAIVPTSPSSYELVDTTERTTRRLGASVAATLAPLAHMFYRNLPERPLVPMDLLRFGLKTTWRDAVLILVMGLAVGLLAMVTPIATGILIGTIIPSGQPSELAALGGAMICAALGSSLYDLVRQFTTLRMETRMEYEVQAGILTRLLMVSAPFFRNYTAGDLSNRLLGIIQVRQVLTSAGTQAILGGVFSIFSYLLLFWYSFKMAMVAGLLVAIYLLLNLGTAWLQLRQQRAILDLDGYLQGLVLQLINGIAKIRVAGVEARAFRRWSRSFSEQRTLTFYNRLLGAALGSVGMAWPVFSSLVLFGVMAWDDYTLLTTGNFLAFNSAFGQFLSSVVGLGGTWVSTQMIVPTIDRARPLMTAPLEVDESKPDPGFLEGGLSVKNISFRYSEGSPLILDHVSVAAAPGEMIAIVGPSGVGKSTLLRLMLGFEKPALGDVFYDGQCLAQLDVQAVRRQIGVVLQDGKLMAGDIMSNIVGSTLLNEDDAWEAARVAGIDDVIRRLPMGMRTFVSENAATFSGGQRQRLMIARAVVGRPRYIFLDEATSALDAEIQEQVTRALTTLQATRVVIAHRLSTIRSADRIYVLDKGRVAQVGKFDELIAQDGLFKELARRQLV